MMQSDINSVTSNLYTQVPAKFKADCRNTLIPSEVLSERTAAISDKTSILSRHVCW